MFSDFQILYDTCMVHVTKTFLKSFQNISGNSFRLCFMKLKLLLIAIEVRRPDGQGSFIVINPKYDVKLEPNIQGFFIAESADDVKR